MTATMENTLTITEKIRAILVSINPETDFDTVVDIINATGIEITDEELFEMQDELPELANFINSCGL